MADPFVAVADCDTNACVADAGELHDEGCPSAPKQLTVAELKRYLADCPDTALVNVEGCDCTGEAYRVVWSAGDTVLIGRWPKE